MPDDLTHEITTQLRDERDELAHALYTVLLHSRIGAVGLIEDRIRGAAERVPALAERFPEIAALASTNKEGPS